MEELAPIFEQIYENRAAIVEARKELDQIEEEFCTKYPDYCI